MTALGWLQAIVFFLIILMVTKPLGLYMARVFQGERTWLTPIFLPLEGLIYRLCGVREDDEMTWYAYALSMLAFSLIGLVYLYILLRTQKWLPFNPQHIDNMAPDLAWNTAVSFTTNTNWQFYSGETAMSYLSQMAGLAWHNFASAAVGIAIAVAVVRGLVRTTVKTLGNFWVDLTRCSLYVLLPISIVVGLFLVWQGMPQNFHGYETVKSIEGFAQSITGGPMASQEVIKELGTNGGGFVNANSASPNENPTPLSNLVEMLLIFSLGAGLTYMYGKMVKDTRQGWAIFTTMAILFFVGFAVAYWAEAAGNPIVHAMGAAGGNMEGKECRFGVSASALFATVTTDTSCGAVNAMHDSFMPLGGLIPLVDMQLGEIVFGGVGSGLYGMIVFVVLTVFIAGLMVGRTPEYLGKKVERREVQFAILAALVTPVLCLVPTAIAAVLPPGLATLNNGGPHGFSEILYAFTSTNANNGSAFAGLGPNLFYNLLTGVNMMFGRFAVAVPALALAGALAGKKAVPESAGTFTTHSGIFVALLIGVIVIVGALTFLPADSLGPIVEHLLVLQGKTF
ncbi:MAG: potassium-transporting ATPase subunit KdpA [Candidatus Eremiobacteraeota bacterium]|nr:potassium-transporting ATPase subunit KdpA [Candidatus Eremiobacteraeota bacterium]